MSVRTVPTSLYPLFIELAYFREFGIKSVALCGHVADTLTL